MRARRYVRQDRAWPGITGGIKAGSLATTRNWASATVAVAPPITVSHTHGRGPVPLGLDEDEGLNSGGQIVGIHHPKLRSHDFLGKGRRHNVRANATRETNGHGVVDGPLEDIALLGLGLGSHLPPDRAEVRDCVDLGEA
jgi:hypothetical protein